MKLIKRLFAGFTLLGLIGGAALGQTIQQSGSLTYGHPLVGVTSGVAMDGGSAAAPATSAVATYGLNSCVISKTGTTAAGVPTNGVNYTGGYVQDCSGPTSATNVTHSITGYGSSTAPTYTLTIQGTSYTISTGSWLTSWFDSQFCSTQGSVLYRSGSAWTCLGPGNSGQVLQTQGVGQNPQWAGSGGIGTVTSITAGTGLTGGTITSSGTIALSSPVSVANGGTASSTLTAHNVLVGEGTNAVAFAAPGVSGTCLTSNGTTADPTFQSCPGTGTVTSVTGGTGITTSPSSITSSGTVNLASVSNNTALANVSGSSAAPTPTGPAALNNMLMTTGAFRSYIAGLTLSNDGSSPNSVLDIASGVAADSTDTVLMNDTTATFKKSTAGSWASGSGSNGMGTGLTIANNTWYHVFEIINSGSVDFYFDTSISAANAPSGTTAFRYIGSFKTDGSAHILAFNQIGDEFIWGAIVADVSEATASSGLFTVTVPPGINVTAEFTAELYFNTTSAEASFLPSQVTSQLGTSLRSNSSYNGAGQFRAVTNTAQQIYLYMRAGGGDATYSVWTYGWVDTRGRLN